MLRARSSISAGVLVGGRRGTSIRGFLVFSVVALTITGCLSVAFLGPGGPIWEPFRGRKLSVEDYFPEGLNVLVHSSPYGDGQRVMTDVTPNLRHDSDIAELSGFRAVGDGVTVDVGWGPPLAEFGREDEDWFKPNSGPVDPTRFWTGPELRGLGASTKSLTAEPGLVRAIEMDVLFDDSGTGVLRLPMGIVACPGHDLQGGERTKELAARCTQLAQELHTEIQGNIDEYGVFRD